MINGILGLAYLAAISFATLLAFAWDKQCARRGDWRVSEQTLLTLVAIGGGLGALAGQAFLRHKTRKQPFVSILYTIIAFQIVVVLATSVTSVRQLLWEMTRTFV